jgi:hypothetical protein
LADNSELDEYLKWLSDKTPKPRQIEVGDIPPGVDLEFDDIAERPDDLEPLLERLKFPRKQSYDLGTVTTGRFLMQSSASHRVVREAEGTSWQVYVSGADFPDGEEFIGDYTSEELAEFAEELGYEINVREWLAIGWRPS